jgi:hypothetical protein
MYEYRSPAVVVDGGKQAEEYHEEGDREEL